MVDIDPAALSRPSVSLTPVLSGKTLSITAPGSQKTIKTSQIIPARIDLEPLYAALKGAIGSEQWLIYKESTAEFLTGRLSQAEYSERIDSLLTDSTGEKDHLHNQLIAAIIGNVTREVPEQGLAPWVSANDKPMSGAGNKAATGDATERRLKGEVMQLPARDRRRIKDLVNNDYDPHESLGTIFADTHRKPPTATDTTPSASTGINNMNVDVEMRKRFAQPLAVESGEFPDANVVTGRMLPFCYEAGLPGGHVSDAPLLVSTAAEAFIKEVLTQIFSRTRSNGPGDSGSAGVGVGTTWIQTHKYKKQLHQEEEGALRGEVTRDKTGLLPVEARAASERGPLGMADLRIALEMADTGMSMFPVLMTQVVYGYREGELERWTDYTWATETAPDVEELPTTGDASNGIVNGHGNDAMDVDDEILWDGAVEQDMDVLDSMLDSCLAIS